MAMESATMQIPTQTAMEWLTIARAILEDLESQENFILLLAAGLLIVALIAILAIITLLKVLQRLDQDGDGDFDMDDVKILGRRLMGSDKIDETMRKK